MNGVFCEHFLQTFLTSLWAINVSIAGAVINGSIPIFMRRGMLSAALFV